MAKVGVQIRFIDENLWRATVFARGSMFVIDYAPGDVQDGCNPDGSPCEQQVRDAWKEDPGAFREV